MRRWSTKNWIKYEIYDTNWISFRFECAHGKGMNEHNKLMLWIYALFSKRTHTNTNEKNTIMLYDALENIQHIFMQFGYCHISFLCQLQHLLDSSVANTLWAQFRLIDCDVPKKRNRLVGGMQSHTHNSTSTQCFIVKCIHENC